MEGSKLTTLLFSFHSAVFPSSFFDWSSTFANMQGRRKRIGSIQSHVKENIRKMRQIDIYNPLSWSDRAHCRGESVNRGEYGSGTRKHVTQKRSVQPWHNTLQISMTRYLSDRSTVTYYDYLIVFNVFLTGQWRKRYYYPGGVSLSHWEPLPPINPRVINWTLFFFFFFPSL